MQAAAQNPLINKAFGVIRVLSQDEEERLLAESREKALRDAWSREDEARDEGVFDTIKFLLKVGKLQLPEIPALFPTLSHQDMERLRKEISQ